MDKALNSLAHALPAAEGVPEWLHLLPAGSFAGEDGRGPYVVKDMQAVIEASIAGGRKLPIDENHAIDHVGAKGGASPARGWVVELQAREDGIWGRVEWTPTGKTLMEERAYGFLSPVFLHTKSKPHRVDKLLRVALTNDPNLASLKSLHTHEETDMEKELREALGLPEDADKDAILKAATAAHAASTSHTALMARLSEISGAAKDASENDLVIALQARVSSSASGEDESEVKELREQVKSLNTQLTQVTAATARKDAEAAIDGAIEAGKLVPALRDHMIARHMKEPGEVETELKAMPALNARSLRDYKPSGEGDGSTLSPDDEAVCSLMGLDPKAFAETSKKLERSAV
ncbi:phage protease [Afifella pfennigii]|uniref:phage protease n=1 Tax=Afifella pfennigii TaxID=209897 RepID=UPI00047B3C76|nr:phage protease [Afifella pfennigii]